MIHQSYISVKRPVPVVTFCASPHLFFECNTGHNHVTLIRTVFHASSSPSCYCHDCIIRNHVRHEHMALGITGPMQCDIDHSTSLIPIPRYSHRCPYIGPTFRPHELPHGSSISRLLHDNDNFRTHSLCRLTFCHFTRTYEMHDGSIKICNVQFEILRPQPYLPLCCRHQAHDVCT